MRVDSFLVKKGFFESRNKAMEAIKNGRVSIDGVLISKPSYKIKDDVDIEVKSGDDYVSRGASKLLGYFREYPLDIDGKISLDIGSSTGGFTQVLLEFGVSRVDSVDVGKNQLHPKLRQDSRVRIFESMDIRDFNPKIKYPLIVSDVSFISLLYLLASIVRLSQNGTDIILLFKPQFEVGKDVKRDRRGVVLDIKAVDMAMDNFENRTKELGWRLVRKVPSSLLGKEGNQEWIYHFRVSQ